MIRFFVGALLSVLCVFAPSSGSGLGAQEVLCERNGVRVTELTSLEEEWVSRILVEPTGPVIDSVSGFGTLQTSYEDPEVGTAPPEGNRVVVSWYESGDVQDPIELFVDFESLCSIPPRTEAGFRSVAIEGLPSSCVPTGPGDPVCSLNLEDCGLFTDRLGSAYTIEISAEGDAFDACQELLSTWPMAQSWRLSFSTREEDDDCEIIVEGETIGPPGTFFQILIDDKVVRESDSFEEFREVIPISTRGSHQIRVRGYRSRESAADDGLQWEHPETGTIYEGISGAFVTAEFTGQVETACGRPKPPRDLTLRQSSYDATSGESVLEVDWRSGDVYTSVEIDVDDGARFLDLPVPPGVDVREALISGLDSGSHSIAVRGRATDVLRVEWERSEFSTAEFDVLATSPFDGADAPRIVLGEPAPDTRTVSLTINHDLPIHWVDIVNVDDGLVVVSERVEAAADGSVEIRIDGEVLGPEIDVVCYSSVAGDLHALRATRLTLPGAVRFVVGDCNVSGGTDLSDAVFTLLSLFGNGGPSTCAAACEVNGDGQLDVSDPVFTLSFLFTAGRLPPRWIDSNGNGVLDDCNEVPASACDAGPSLCR